MKINIKPISVNECWQGRRFKTPKYKGWESSALSLLPSKSEAFGSGISGSLNGCLTAFFTFGVSSKNSDLDNLVKPFLDVLQKKYGFNDKQIVRLIMEKKQVEKGEEFVEFQITPHAVTIETTMYSVLATC